MQYISEHSKDVCTRGSPIRAMFELGAKLAAQYGRENVFDFSLGNPALEPPKEFKDALERLSKSEKTGLHAYTPNRGNPACIEAYAKRVSKMHGDIEVPPECLCVSVGAAGAINVFFHAIVTPGEEIIAFAPYFCEYSFYAENVGATLRVLPCSDGDFEPDIEALKAAISEKTRAIIINSPNNPSGKVYSQKIVDTIAEVAKSATEKYKKAVWIVSDEPYAKIIYGHPAPKNCNVFATPHEYNVVVTSFSKDLSIPGERLGYIAIDPRAGAKDGGRQLIMGSCTFWTRVLGFVNAPAIIQLACAEACDAEMDVDWYDARRKALCNGLREAGLEIKDPEGAFYAFPKVPEGVKEDVFVNALAKRCVLAVPGSAFGKPGYLRFSYAVKSVEMIERACKLIKEAVDEVKKQ